MPSCAALPSQFIMPQVPAGSRQPQVHMISLARSRSSAERNTSVPEAVPCAHTFTGRLRERTPTGVSSRPTSSSAAVASAPTRAPASANTRSGSSAMPVPSAISPKPIQIQLTSSLTCTSTLADCSPSSKPAITM